MLPYIKFKVKNINEINNPPKTRYSVFCLVEDLSVGIYIIFPPLV